MMDSPSTRLRAKRLRAQTSYRITALAPSQPAARQPRTNNAALLCQIHLPSLAASSTLSSTRFASLNSDFHSTAIWGSIPSRRTTRVSFAVGVCSHVGTMPITVAMEIGRARINIRNLLQLNQGSVVELDRLAGEPMDVLVNGTLIAQGEVVVVNEKFGIRLTDIVSPSDRVKKLSG